MEDIDVKEILSVIGMLLLFCLLCAFSYNAKTNQEPKPLDSGTIYEMQEIPAHTEIPANHNGYLVYEDTYIIGYQKTVNGELKQDQWYVDKEIYEKYRVGDWFDYNEEQEHCSSNRSWTRINGNDYDVWTYYIISSGAF